MTEFTPDAIAKLAEQLNRTLPKGASILRRWTVNDQQQRLEKGTFGGATVFGDKITITLTYKGQGDTPTELVWECVATSKDTNPKFQISGKSLFISQKGMKPEYPYDTWLFELFWF